VRVRQGLHGNDCLVVFVCKNDQILHWYGTGPEVIAETAQANGKALQDMLADLLYFLCLGTHHLRSRQIHYGCAMLLACQLGVEFAWIVVVKGQREYIRVRTIEPSSPGEQTLSRHHQSSGVQ
jgi:hypothetical protein